MDRPPLAPATNRPAVETHLVTEEAKPARSGSPLANTLLGFDGAAARPAGRYDPICGSWLEPPADASRLVREADLATGKLQLKASVQVTTRSAAPGFKITIKMNGLGLPELDENSYDDALALTGPYPPSKVNIGDNLRVVLTKFDPGITSIGGATF